MNSLASSQLFGLVRQHPLRSICAGLSIALASSSWFLWQNVSALSDMHRDRAEEGKAMLAMLAAGPLMRQELVRTRDAARRIEQGLVVETNLAENLWYFYKLEEQTKVRLSKLRQLSSNPADTNSPYKLIPYTLELTGSYEQVAGFLLLLETGDRFAVIKSFSFRREEPDAPVLVLELEVGLLGKK